MSLLTERFSEKYAKKLIGRTDLEDALDRLDKLTHEQAQMVAAEVQKSTRVIDGSVGGVREQAPAVDDRVAVVDDKVVEAVIGERIIISEA
jgi:hypothetical protein